MVDVVVDHVVVVGLDVVEKSKSASGGWYYVQPMDSNLPVGIASCDEQEGAKPLHPGDEVQIRLEGVDEKRGQISFTVL